MPVVGLEPGPIWWEAVTLTNGLSGVLGRGRKRGIRPRWFCLIDPPRIELGRWCWAAGRCWSEGCVNTKWRFTSLGGVVIELHWCYQLLSIFDAAACFFFLFFLVSWLAIVIEFRWGVELVNVLVMMRVIFWTNWGVFF